MLSGQWLAPRKETPHTIAGSAISEWKNRNTLQIPTWTHTHFTSPWGLYIHISWYQDMIIIHSVEIIGHTHGTTHTCWAFFLVNFLLSGEWTHRGRSVYHVLAGWNGIAPYWQIRNPDRTHISRLLPAPELKCCLRGPIQAAWLLASTPLSTTTTPFPHPTVMVEQKRAKSGKMTSSQSLSRIFWVSLESETSLVFLYRVYHICHPYWNFFLMQETPLVTKIYTFSFSSRESQDDPVRLTGL